MQTYFSLGQEINVFRIEQIVKGDGFLLLGLVLLQFPNDPVALSEWFLFSVALVVIVTILYVYILNRTPAPEGLTVAKLEQSQSDTQKTLDPHPALQQASQSLQSGNLKGAVESSVRAVSLALGNILVGSGTQDLSAMSISDMAYLVQTRAKSSPQIAQPVYQLNTLRLKAVQNQVVDQQEAAWAVSLANWLVNQTETQQVKL